MKTRGGRIGVSNVGASLLAKASIDPASMLLTHRYREQARFQRDLWWGQ
ncbi:hypothetical protein FBY09_10117 [Pseudomonas sp. SJZ101]|nr:hypothetical protein FBY00_13117 [Pseudomonas sp. SJZ075]TWC28154.1 hypothetical protein FBY02_13345 [Pseudomonas sp. SJZ078]TWC47888.1 hypothetical protein FBY11_13145 [Pseudomonas sp. SJZ124]TWC94154.1 hypothetical protein FBY09_10117 [Pseudomonas sp. SJZ101]